MLSVYLTKNARVWLMLCIVLVIVWLHYALRSVKVVIVYDRTVVPLEPTKSNQQKRWPLFKQTDIDRLSVLGRILYLNQTPPWVPTPGKKHQILIWKYGRTIEDRHMKYFGSNYLNPLENCSVKNCEIVYDDDSLSTADMVVFHMQRLVDGEKPKRTNYDQIWAFLTDESPYHTFMGSNSWALYNGVFNWSITYRMDSDIPVPYGRTILRKNPSTTPTVIFKRRDVLVTVMLSDCSGKNARWDYIRALQKHIQVNIYGGCGPLKCDGYMRRNCPDIDAYMFYLAFENSNCDGYITEKLWWNSYHKNSIPIVMGAKRRDYDLLLPPDSFINAEDYPDPRKLAEHILYLNRTGRFVEYFRWKQEFEVLNEHGYFQSASWHYCRMCEALNYNGRKRKVYGELKEFWSVAKDCHPPIKMLL